MVDGNRDAIATPSRRRVWWMSESVLAGAWLLAGIHEFSLPGPGTLATLLLGVAGLALGASWSLRTLLGIPGFLGRRGWALRRIARGATTPAAGAIGVLLLATDLDLVLRLKLSEGPMRAHAERVLGGTQPAERSRLGLFPIERAARAGDSVRFTVRSGPVFEEHGVYYSPGGTPPTERGETTSPLFGAWHQFTWND